MALELELSFDEASGDALDSSGNGRNLVISSANFGSRVAGLYGTSAFQQLSTATTIGPTLSAGMQTASRTTMFWLRVNASGTYWIDEYYNAANDTGVWGLLYLSGVLRWRAKNVSNTPTDITITPDNGVWHHIAAVFDGAKLWIYRDGVLVNTGGTAISGGLMSADTFRFMESAGSAATIEDFRHYSSALTQPEIAALMATPAGAAPTDSGTLTGSFSSPTAALAANGSVDALLAGSFSSPTTAYDGSATAEVTLDGTFTAPTFSLEGSSVSPNTGGLNGSFAAPDATFSARSSVDVSMIGTFSIPVFTGSGGVPIPDRDILVTIGPGERPATSIAAGPSRVNVAQSDLQRTEIGD
jgi:hypothetical protein